MNIVLTDIDGEIIKAWNKLPDRSTNVTVFQGSIFEVECDAIVSPANSFGFMDGSLDFAISEYFGWHIQERLQEAIKTKHNGELLVGQVEIVPTDHQSIPYVISAPTMRVPMDIRGTLNPYLAIRGVLLAIKNGVFKDGTLVKDKIKTIAFPGMGTGVGQITPYVFAKQMEQAIEDIVREKYEFPKTIWDAEKMHTNINK
jgi:O-acetyl-ADP-ribose deacetylase (regulator of RNase III)